MEEPICVKRNSLLQMEMLEERIEYCEAQASYGWRHQCRHSWPRALPRGPVKATPPNVKVTPPNVKVTPPNVKVTPPNVRATPPNVRDTPPNVRATPPNVKATPPKPNVSQDHCFKTTAGVTRYCYNLIINIRSASCRGCALSTEGFVLSCFNHKVWWGYIRCFKS